jgi:DNA-binding MarR family transcriptional regulator
MEPNEETGRLFLHLKAAQAAMRAAMADALSDLGITPPQLLILRAIELSPAISSAQLARETFVSPQAMVANVTKLCEAGLIERSKGQGRTIETHLTAKGHETLERAADRVEGLVRYVTNRLGGDTVRKLDASLLTLTEALTQSLVTTTTRTWDDD